MTSTYIQSIRRAADAGDAIAPELALRVLTSQHGDLPDLMAAAHAMKRRFFGDRIICCSILNAKSGACSENCAFCAQSAHHQTGAQIYGLKEVPAICKAYADACALPITHFGIVTSGGAMDENGIRQICDAIRSKSIPEIAWCASLGSLSPEQLARLKAAGLRRFHHNLETAPSFFPSICNTHSFEDRVRTLRAVKQAGLEICSGGILGMGESLEQRVEFALTLQQEEVDSIPLNFLVPVPGTRMEGREPMKPLDMLRSIIMFRLVHPRAELKVCAGRTYMRDIQSMIFNAGATGMMIGPLLTVAGRDVGQDLQMLKDLELDYAQ
jgi:biotin synthase